MAQNGEEIAELLVLASAALKAIADAQGASAAARKKAKQSYIDVLRLIARHAITTYEGRTAALTGLMVELREVTDGIKVENPIAGQLDQIAGFGERAAALFKKEKKNA